MEINQFVEKADVNPLFWIRQLKDNASDILNVLTSEHPRAEKREIERAIDRIQAIQNVVEHLLEYLRQLGAVSEGLLMVLDQAVTAAKEDGLSREDSFHINDDQDDILSQEERARLQQHIPGFDTSARDPEIQKRLRAMKPLLNVLRRKLEALIKEHYQERSGATSRPKTDKRKNRNGNGKADAHSEDTQQAQRPQEASASAAIEAVAKINQQHVTTAGWRQAESRKDKRHMDTARLREEREKRRLAYEEEQRQYEKRRNPANWPVLTYDIEDTISLVGPNNGCVLRVPEGTNTRRLQCTTKDVIVEAGPNELLASSVVCLATKDQEPIRFEFPALISLPYKPIDGLEPVVYTKEGQGHWMAVASKQHIEGDIHMAQFERSTLQHLTFAVKMSHIRHYHVTAKETVINDQDDQSIRIFVPQNTFRSEGEIRLKVTDQEHLLETRSRLSDSDMLDSLSALCHVHIEGSRNGAIHVEIGFNVTSSLPAILPPGHRVHLMTSVDGVRWTRTEPIRTEDNKRYVREMAPEDIDAWLLLVRTKGFYNPNDTPKLSREILLKLTELPFYVLLYQHKDSPERVHLQTCTPGTVCKVVNLLEQEGYTESTARLAHMPDGSYLHIRPSAEGNIEFTEDVTCPIIRKHMSCLDTGELASPVRIKVRNIYIQKNHKAFGGKIQVFGVMSRVVEEGSSRDETRVFLCELPVSLPKESVKTEEGIPVQKPRTFIGAEPLTAGYFRQLSRDLGDKWIDVLLRLGLSNTTIQKVLSKWPDPEDAKFELFTIWYLRSNKDGLKISQLIRALRDVGRSDLEQALHARYDVIMEEKRLKNKESLLSLLARRVATDPRALDDWKNILRALNLDENTISAIEEERHPVNRIYCLQQGLIQWLRLSSSGSNPRDVYKTLKQLGHLAAADQVSRWLGLKNV